MTHTSGVGGSGDPACPTARGFPRPGNVMVARLSSVLCVAGIQAIMSTNDSYHSPARTGRIKLRIRNRNGTQGPQHQACVRHDEAEQSQTLQARVQARVAPVTTPPTARALARRPCLLLVLEPSRSLSGVDGVGRLHSAGHHVILNAALVGALRGWGGGREGTDAGERGLFECMAAHRVRYRWQACKSCRKTVGARCDSRGGS
jgi:hypothetical protein